MTTFEPSSISFDQMKERNSITLSPDVHLAVKIKAAELGITMREACDKACALLLKSTPKNGRARIKDGK